jgi:hypothetical protein
MEGTLGSADRAPLRGGSQEAALPEGLAKVGSPGAGLAQAWLAWWARRRCTFRASDRAAPPAVLSRARDRGCPSHAVGVTNLGVNNHSEGCSIRRKPYRAPEPRKLGWSGPERDVATQEAHHEGNLGTRTNGAREIPVVLVNCRDCRRRRATLSPSCESRWKGHGVDGRRSGSIKSPSFDEAAVEANLAFPLKGARQRASAAGLRPSRWPNTPQGGSTHRKALDQEPTGPRGAGPIGKPRDIDSHAKARGSPSSEALPEITSFAKAPAGRAAVEATIQGESRRLAVIRESSDSQGARVVMSVAEVG